MSAGGGLILAIRAEYGLMTWPEVGSAFAYFLPTHVPFRASAMRRLPAGPNRYVRFNRDGVAQEMTREQIAEGDRRASEWKPIDQNQPNESDPVLPT